MSDQDADDARSYYDHAKAAGLPEETVDLSWATTHDPDAPPIPTGMELAAILAQLAPALAQIYAGLDRLGGMIREAFHANIMCLRCWDERAKAQLLNPGAAPEDLPMIAVVNVIENGNGVCVNHRGSGLIIPGR